jgi:hypothetical protein
LATISRVPVFIMCGWTLPDRRAANKLARFANSLPVEAPLRFWRGEVEGPQAGRWYANFPACRSRRRECNTAHLYGAGKVGIVFSWLFFTAMNLGQLISTPVGS